MDTEINKGGRPKAQAPRSHKVKISLTSSEYNQLQAALEKRKEGTTAEFCRSLIMDALAGKKWLSPEELRDTRNAFTSIGRNLNQIAKVLNSEKGSTPQLRKDLSQSLTYIRELSLKLLRGTLPSQLSS